MRLGKDKTGEMHLAVNLMKISNDLRLMNSGPKGGLAEIRLAPLPFPWRPPMANLNSMLFCR
ncbi:hypothetical protein [Dehalobacter sp. TBBPA1]|uniref:hypothetical protein n=1 Tax=Dehalobacter sp. TBBPA1 TaxID=3235037 RepID=UPI0034A5D220